MATSDEYPEKNAWWINELNSLGIKNEKIEKLRDRQALENLADDLKQLFLHGYRDRLK
jgi:nucleoside-specific outer membrane channel protein Tsx